MAVKPTINHMITFSQMGKSSMALSFSGILGIQPMIFGAAYSSGLALGTSPEHGSGAEKKE